MFNIKAFATCRKYGYPKKKSIYSVIYKWSKNQIYLLSIDMRHYSRNHKFANIIKKKEMNKCY